MFLEIYFYPEISFLILKNYYKAIYLVSKSKYIAFLFDLDYIYNLLKAVFVVYYLYRKYDKYL